MHEKLLVIKTAFEENDESVADEVLTELMEKTWSSPTKKLLSLIHKHLLHSDYDMAADAISEFCG